jgi:hypothetical protein
MILVKINRKKGDFMEVLNNKEVDFSKRKNGIFTFTVNIPLKTKDKSFFVGRMLFLNMPESPQKHVVRFTSTEQIKH